MVELKKSSDFPDIFKLKKCCYLVVQVDTFNRRPGVSQFNHLCKNCHRRTRCLKCGESHRTNDCPIKEKIVNPICITCNKPGHMANWSQREKFPKIKKKQDESVLNRNTVKKTEANKTFKPVTSDLPFEATLKGVQNDNKKSRTSAPTESPQIND
ncbi:uncharacterized protein TNCV_5116441 [Trichonephila clavipes]|nr:uncharacterized protein TNCV_5116441 [Trichonephila clavipes]